MRVSLWSTALLCISTVVSLSQATLEAASTRAISRESVRNPRAATAVIVVGERAPELEQYAARELQKYLYQVSGELLPVQSDARTPAASAFIVGQPTTNRAIARLTARGIFSVTSDDPGPEGYALKTTESNRHPLLAITGSDQSAPFMECMDSSKTTSASGST